MLGSLTGAGAQPSSPIRLVVAFAPGGGVDVVARLVADRLSVALKQIVVVENRPGAAGVIAARQVVSAEPDGRTILVASNPLLINQVLRPETNFPVLSELTPIASVAPQSIVIVVGANVPARSLKELFDLARDRDLNYATTGSGSLSHLAIEFLLAARPGARMQHIPFQGSAPALTAVMSGQVEVGSSTVPPAVPLINSGKLRALAVANAKRSVMLPNVPTFAEAGFPTLPVSAWVGFFVSSRTPASLVDALSRAIVEIAEQPELSKKLLDMGFEPESSGADEFKRELSTELRLWSDVATRLRVDKAK
jgi:tripartite-type tricarboxylate transporter receptor subunit TctC